ncbi:ATP-binding protein [Sinosporangium siamense]|nr:ATP-binding protein [Sinosporangium siamense]
MRVVGIGWGDTDHPARIRQGAEFPRRVDIPGTPCQVAWVRRWVHEFLDLECVAAETSEVIVLLTSELVTNAVVHSHSGDGEVTVLLDLNHEHARIRLDVIDNGPAVVVAPVCEDPDREGGRGLALVDGLADRWGGYLDEHGTGVWFELCIPAWADEDGGA